MQLRSKSRGRITAALGLMTAGLFAGMAHAQSVGPDPAPTCQNINDDTSTDVGKTRIDSAILFYQEAGGRVQATEPVVGVTFNDEDGDSLNVKLTADTLTGATPNGAAPWKDVQTFIAPTKTQGTSATVTGASGHSTVVTIPGTDVKASQYTAPANTLPLDYGFQDKRYAVDLSYTEQLSDSLRFTRGVSVSTERDFHSASLNLGFTKDLNSKNTTVGLAGNFEFDQSKPAFGIPEPLTEMSGTKKGSPDGKVVFDMVGSVSQVMTRNWLMQVNLSLGDNVGYQTDPYRVISVVNATTGAPVKYLYESRPRTRIRQSLYVGNKIAFLGTVTDLSGRVYHDSWGLNATSAELSERIPITSWLYIEPNVRYYHQTAAKFFRDYLVDGEALPANASSDSRIGTFNATTTGLKVGMRVLDGGELYLRAENYQQSGAAHPAAAIGELKNQNLFTGIKATSVIVGYSIAFE